MSESDPFARIGETFREFREDMKEDLGDIKDELVEVKRQTTATNGSVRELQIWRARMEGFYIAARVVPVLAGIVLSAGVTAAITLLLSH